MPFVIHSWIIYLIICLNAGMSIGNGNAADFFAFMECTNNREEGCTIVCASIYMRMKIRSRTRACLKLISTHKVWQKFLAKDSWSKPSIKIRVVRREKITYSQKMIKASIGSRFVSNLSSRICRKTLFISGGDNQITTLLEHGLRSLPKTGWSEKTNLLWLRPSDDLNLI